MTRYVVDESWSRNDTVVYAGSPLSRFTFSGTALVERLESGADMDATSIDIISRLLDAGAIHPLPGPHPYTAHDVTVVIPARVATATDENSLASLLAALPADSPIVIVDDASPRMLNVASPARIIRHAVQRGPGASRNAGLNEVTTPFVAFIDCDVAVPAGLFANLLPYFTDDRVGLIAPRIESAPGVTALARYEQIRSPLDLGPTEAPIRAGSRVGYVPSAMWLCRTEALRAIDGFDESLLTGEDVDAVWRLDRAGWRCRYQPNVSCFHQPRTSVIAMLAQRAGYGRSAASLAAKHRHLVAPVRTTPTVAAAWTLGALLSPLLGAIVTSVNAVRLKRKLEPTTYTEVARLTVRTHRHAGAMFAAALTRTWWPLALVAALLSVRARRVLIFAAVLPATVDWRRRRASIDPLRFLTLRVLDDAAYGFGVWQGVRRHRSAAALRPAITRGRRPLP